MEKDNDSKEESSDYSCSPVTKNELLTAAKYRAIKFAILLVPAISISLFLFICSKSLSRLLRVLPWKTKNEGKFHLSLPPFPILENLNSFKTLSFPFLFPSTPYILTFYLLFSCRSQFLPFSVCQSRKLLFIDCYKIIFVFL